ncbi:hypothetical protein, partial [Pandoraea apista]|uniref:hypothetical protein n=1 Tax=Pandoraea apista TaxID=93218 RepID=UPI001C8C6D5C
TIRYFKRVLVSSDTWGRSTAAAGRTTREAGRTRQYPRQSVARHREVGQAQHDGQIVGHEVVGESVLGQVGQQHRQEDDNEKEVELIAAARSRS